MRHPFGGIIGPAEVPAKQPEASKPTRRSLFGLATGAVAAGTLGLLALGSTKASAQRVTTLMVGEEGGRRPPSQRPTTLMIGEEGGRRRGWKK